MSYPIISKPAAVMAHANLADYTDTYAHFSWLAEQRQLTDLGAGKINMAYEAVDRHLGTATENCTAIRFLAKDSEQAQDISYAELAAESNRFANLLQQLGLQVGDRVFCLSSRIPDLYSAALGCLKHGCVFSPLFSAFGPEPIRARMEIGKPVAIITTEKLFTKKMADWIKEVPFLKFVLLIGDVEGSPAGTINVREQLKQCSSQYAARPMEPEAMALLHFTSGTTGKPKGAIHVHQAVLEHHYSGKFALDLHPGDIYWCTADPGWVTGTSYGIISPLTNGVTMIIDEAEFDAERWYRILQNQKVSVWYTAPTAIRMLMKYGRELAQQFDLSALRFLASVGEPLNPEAVMWGMETFGKPFHDNWWQTETGGIMVANYACLPIKPGSMGKPLPGVTAAIAKRTDSGMEFITDANETGELVLKIGWPSMFRGYLNEAERYKKTFVGDWYFTGDLARCDADGYFWFIGRSDDVIKSSGHLIGPFEVESVLIEHPAVAEAGVIGVPDEVGGEVVKAFVALKPGYTASDALVKEMLGHARKRLGPAVAPKSIVIQDSLPKTRSGKIMRRLLKARELGLPEGDLSTLEGNN